MKRNILKITRMVTKPVLAILLSILTVSSAVSYSGLSKVFAEPLDEYASKVVDTGSSASSIAKSEVDSIGLSENTDSIADETNSGYSSSIQNVMNVENIEGQYGVVNAGLSFSVEPTTRDAAIGEVFEITASGYLGNLVFDSLNTDVASVEKTGADKALVTAAGEGKTKIKVSDSESEVLCDVNVYPVSLHITKNGTVSYLGCESLEYAFAALAELGFDSAEIVVGKNIDLSAQATLNTESSVKSPVSLKSSTANPVTITASTSLYSSMIDVGSNSSLKIMNIQIDGNKTQRQQNGSPMVNNLGTLEVANGAILKNNIAENGGGIFNTGVLTLSGGEINGNTAESGGGVDNEGTFSMSGGTISENISMGNGGGVINAGTFNITGGEINKNTAENSGGGIYSGGYNVGSSFIMSGGIISENTAVYAGGVHNFGTFNMTDGEINKNTAENSGGAVINEGTFNMTGGSINGNTVSVGFGLGGGVYNYNEFSMTGGTIDKNTANYGGGVSNEGTFTLSAGTISNNTAPIVGGGIYNTNKFSMLGGAISGNATDGDGGGVNNWCDFSMMGGTIDKNTAHNGGGVANAGTLNMSNGAIIKNTANYCGGVSNEAKFNMTGGAINDNTADVGGGIYNAKNYGDERNGKLTISNGTISGNTAEDGGGIYNLSEVTIFNCDISKNKANVRGGGIDNSSDATFTMFNGTISENTSMGNGGGVINEGTFNMVDGTINKNVSTYNGGAVYNKANASGFTMSGGTISENTSGSGGGIINESTFSMTGGIIYKNTATYYGGGVFNEDIASSFIMSGGTINENTARYGGGVFNTVVYGGENYSDYNVVFTMTGGEISNNTAQKGSEVYNSATFNLSGTSIIREAQGSDGIFLEKENVVNIAGELTGGKEQIFKITPEITDVGTEIIKAQNSSWLDLSKFKLEGKTLEKVKAEDGSWVIKIAKPANPFTIDPMSKTITLGESFEIKASNYDSAAISAKVLSGPVSIVQVSGDTIKVTGGLLAGEAEIEVKAEASENYSESTQICKVTVNSGLDSGYDNNGTGLFTGDNTMNTAMAIIAMIAITGIVFTLLIKRRKIK